MKALFLLAVLLALSGCNEVESPKESLARYHFEQCLKRAEPASGDAVRECRIAAQPLLPYSGGSSQPKENVR